mgnify:CR=1 FL=1
MAHANPEFALARRAHLDGPTADAVIRDLLEASGGRTVVMVSHHPVAFDALDRVVELEFARA